MLRTTVPETAGSWVAPAVSTGVRLLPNLPAGTVIYGRAMPGSSNVVAWHLARASGLPYVAHFSDEWPAVNVLSTNRKILAPYKWPLFALWRQRILRDAGALTFTNPLQAAEMLGERHRIHINKVFVAAHLASATEGGRVPPQFDRFHIVHTGNLYPPTHSAAPLMEGLRLFVDRTPAAANVVDFTQAGWGDGDIPVCAERFGLQGIVRCVGRLDQAGVLRLLDAASLLIAIDYDRPRSSTLLSKLPDYLLAARPILAIASPLSSMGRLFEEDGAGLIAPHHSPSDIAQRIGDVFAAWRRRALEPLLPRAAALESFSPQRVLTELAGAFETAVEAVRTRRNGAGARSAALRQAATS